MLTIVWDVDDVLNSLMLDWFTGWKKTNAACRLSYSDITENPPDRVLGITEREYLDSLDRFRLSEAAGRMLPNPELLDWFQSCGRRYRHVALTARPLHTAPPAAEWVLRHFGDFIRTFGVVPCRSAPNTPRYDTTKGDFLKWWRQADILVDDSRSNIEAARQIGIRGILFPQPWNASPDSAANVLRALTETDSNCI